MQVKFLVASHLITFVLSPRLHDLMFSLIANTALLEMSINTANLAPRLKASIARAPVPAKRSNMQAFSTSKARILNIDSRIRSEVGLVFVPLIDRIFLPFKFPLIILKYLSLRKLYYRFSSRLVDLKGRGFEWFFQWFDKWATFWFLQFLPQVL